MQEIAYQKQLKNETNSKIMMFFTFIKTKYSTNAQKDTYSEMESSLNF